ncbi:MAG: hypothetical protein CFH34_00185 [Alphaproteobacteria bacterium MarineAlpha9_Bin4]|nr:sodium:solute symporter [Pelagibacterales bacterium]PPR27469.1 MAG: hypothetical protein CFH34_00185 [Alphaproteobacteria bacterium MarineAlpha9_Bin4]
MESINIISKFSAISLTLLISIFFILVGIYYSKKFTGLNNYLVANRSIGTFSLTTSLVASALGAWVLFGPASAATWGGIGAVIGYSLGAAFPLFVLIDLGQKLREKYPEGKTLTEIIKLKLGNSLFKLTLCLSIFYMTIFLIAEVTAVSTLIKYLSGTELSISAFIIITTSLIYTLYGGLRVSIFTDNIQFLILFFLLLISFSFLFYFNISSFSISFIKENKPDLLSAKNFTNFTAGLTFFIAVAATNLFHQGNWQRVYAAKSSLVLKKSLIISFIIIIPIVFLLGYTGLIAVSKNSNIFPDLAFFTLLLENQTILLSVLTFFLGISLTISSIDTLINAISSVIVVDGNKVIKYKGDYLKLSKIILILLSIITFTVASKGLSILYLFLLADLFCCAAVASIFFSFYKKSNDERNIFISILAGLIGGLLFFPSPDFTKSIIIGVIFPIEYVPVFISQSLLFLSFLIATFLPVVFWKIKF